MIYVIAGLAIVILFLKATDESEKTYDDEDEEWACTSYDAHGNPVKVLTRGKDDEEIEYRKHYRDYLRRYYRKYRTYKGAEDLHDLGRYKWDYSDVDNPHKTNIEWSDYESPYETLRKTL